MTFHSPTEIDYTFYIMLGYKFVTISLQMHLLIQLFNIQVSFSDIIHSNKPTSKSTIYKLDEKYIAFVSSHCSITSIILYLLSPCLFAFVYSCTMRHLVIKGNTFEMKKCMCALTYKRKKDICYIKIYLWNTFSLLHAVFIHVTLINFTVAHSFGAPSCLLYYIT